MLAACMPNIDALIARITTDKEPFCGNATVYAVVDVVAAAAIIPPRPFSGGFPRVIS